MLVITPAAAKVVNSITSADDVPEGSGLRIAAANGTDDFVLEVEIVTGPDEQDQVVDDRGVLVFLDPAAASYLDDKVLNAHVNDNGEAQFTLFTQDGHTIPS